MGPAVSIRCVGMQRPIETKAQSGNARACRERSSVPDLNFAAQDQPKGRDALEPDHPLKRLDSRQRALSTRRRSVRPGRGTSSALLSTQACLACDRPLDATEALPRPRDGADWHMSAVTCQVISSPPIHPSIHRHRHLHGRLHPAINYHRRRARHESDRSSCCCYLDQTDSELSDAPTTRVTNYRVPLGAPRP